MATAKRLSLSVWLAFALICSAFGSESANAQVVSMSRVSEVQTDTGSYKQYSVNCGSRLPARFVRKNSDDSTWCDAVLGEYCARQRLKAAELVCSRRYTAALKNTQQMAPPASTETPVEKVTSNTKPTPTQVVSRPILKKTKSKAELNSELREIEEQLIELQAEKLDLRAKDLELMKRQAKP